MGDGVKSLAEVKKDHIGLSAVTDALYLVIDGWNKLGFTRKFLSKAMLVISNDIVGG